MSPQPLHTDILCGLSDPFSHSGHKKTIVTSGSKLAGKLQETHIILIKTFKKKLLRVLGPGDFHINFHMVFEEKSMNEQ